MTAHELARKLLSMEDLNVLLYVGGQIEDEFNVNKQEIPLTCVANEPISSNGFKFINSNDEYVDYNTEQQIVIG